MDRLGFSAAMFPELIDPGETVGLLLPRVAAAIGSGPHLGVTAVGSHGTASAVVAVPATVDDFAYISCETWSLVGVELEHPVVTEAGRDAGFTNERGVDGRIRFLHNVMGLWLLNESIRHWRTAGERIEISVLLRAAAAVSVPVAIFDSDDPRLLAPGNMPERIAQMCVEHNLEPPASHAEMARSILESLAHASARTLDDARRLTGVSVEAVHLVGGGTRVSSTGVSAAGSGTRSRAAEGVTGGSITPDYSRARPSMAVMSSSVRVKPNTAMFSRMRDGVADLGMTMFPSCRCQRMTT